MFRDTSTLALFLLSLLTSKCRLIESRIFINLKLNFFVSHELQLFTSVTKRLVFQAIKSAKSQFQ